MFFIELYDPGDPKKLSQGHENLIMHLGYPNEVPVPVWFESIQKTICPPIHSEVGYVITQDTN